MSFLSCLVLHFFFFFFFFNDTATTEIYTLSLHDALPVVLRSGSELDRAEKVGVGCAADIAHVRARGWLEVCVDAVAAHVQAGVFSGLVVVHEVHMAEEPVMLASSEIGRAHV